MKRLLGHGMLGAMLLGVMVGCDPPTQSPQKPEQPVAPWVIQLVNTASHGNPEGKDVTILRAFLVHRDLLTSVDVDCMVRHVSDNVIRGFISAEYYANLNRRKDIEEKP